MPFRFDDAEQSGSRSSRPDFIPRTAWCGELPRAPQMPVACLRKLAAFAGKSSDQHFSIVLRTWPSVPLFCVSMTRDADWKPDSAAVSACKRFIEFLSHRLVAPSFEETSRKRFGQNSPARSRQDTPNAYAVIAHSCRSGHFVLRNVK